MISVRSVFRQVPDPRGKQGLQHPLEALLGLILLSMLSGRKGMRAVFRLGRTLSRHQLNQLGFRQYLASHVTRRLRNCCASLIRMLWPKPSVNSPPNNEIVTGMKRCSVSFQLMARPFAAVRTQTARPNMFCQRLAQHLPNLWAIVHHEVKVLKYQTRCVFWKRST